MAQERPSNRDQTGCFAFNMMGVSRRSTESQAILTMHGSFMCSCLIVGSGLVLAVISSGHTDSIGDRSLEKRRQAEIKMSNVE